MLFLQCPFSHERFAGIILMPQCLLKVALHVPAVGSGVFPSLIFVHGPEQRTLVLDHTPFSVGRKMDKDLVIADPRVSRDHALLVSENGKVFVEDQGSKHGTFVNGERVSASNWNLMIGSSSARGTPFRGLSSSALTLQIPLGIS